MKNVVKLQHYYFPWELEATLRDFVAYYNNERDHDSLDNVTPADIYFGRRYEVLTKRDKMERRTKAEGVPVEQGRISRNQEPSLSKVRPLSR